MEEDTPPVLVETPEEPQEEIEEDIQELDELGQTLARTHEKLLQDVENLHARISELERQALSGRDSGVDGHPVQPDAGPETPSPQDEKKPRSGHIWYRPIGDFFR
ncbi:MAG TPA: hypothetical protein VFK47_13245 [Ktedonobacteraceae bacterium]|nr:hypothetical protein [Ktedonobacteraceae bacterium]